MVGVPDDVVVGVDELDVDDVEVVGVLVDVDVVVVPCSAANEGASYSVQVSR